MEALLASALFGAAIMVAIPTASPALEAVRRLLDRDTARIRDQIKDLPVQISPNQLRQLMVARIVVLGLAVVIAYFSLFLTGLLFFIAWVAPRLIADRARERHFEQLATQLPDAVAVLVRSVRTQGSLAEALGEVVRHTDGAAKYEFQRLYDECHRYGLELELTLQRARDRVPVEGFRMMTSALSVSLKNGGDLPLVLEQIARSTRELSALREKIVTESASMRGQMSIMIYVAPLFIFVSGLVSPGAWSLLFLTLRGNVILALVFSIQFFAWLRMRRIVRSII